MSESALDVSQAAAGFAEIFSETPKEPAKEPVKAEEVKEAPVPAEEGADAEPEVEAEGESETPPEETVTIEVDGKTVELTKAELADAYKSGLRQSDYTKKTMEVSEQRKAAEAEITKARQERETYAQNLQQQTALLSAVLQEQNKIDWQQLLDTDPVEYLKQQHLFQQRQAALTQAQSEQQKVWQLQQAEQAENVQKFLSQQQEELLAKLPDWKDESKAKAEKSALRDYLKETGFNDNEVGQVQDHRHVIIARKAMLYDQMMAKAKAAAKQVQNLPQKTLRAGTGESPNLDKRGALFQKFNKSGSVEDAGRLFASIL